MPAGGGITVQRLWYAVCDCLCSMKNCEMGILSSVWEAWFHGGRVGLHHMLYLCWAWSLFMVLLLLIKGVMAGVAVAGVWLACWASLCCLRWYLCMVLLDLGRGFSPCE